MKAIILAAGMGTRLGKYTENLPKGMLEFNGKALIEWQVLKLREAGVTDISIITGYMGDRIRISDVTYFHNENFATTNMVESLMCAREILNDDVLVAYGDVIYTSKLAQLAVHYDGDIGVAADRSWRNYWIARYGTTEADLESLAIENGKIVELGLPREESSGIDFRYIGLIKFSAMGMRKALEIYDKKKDKNEHWVQSGNEFKQGYMTDLLNEIIIEGEAVSPIVTDGGWVEFDTVEDYEVMLRELENDAIAQGFF